MTTTQMQHVTIPAHGGYPYLRVVLEDSDGATVDLSTGYDQFTARAARDNAPTTSVLSISSGVTGDAGGFLVPIDQLSALNAAFDYQVTATARHTATGKYRRAKAIISIDPTPAV